MKYAIEVDHPIKGWTRLQARYANRKLARSWYPFVKAAWHCLPVRTVEVEDGPPVCECPVCKCERPPSAKEN